MKAAATIQTTILFLASALVLAACNDDNQKSYVEYYHPQPSVIFASNPGTLKYNPKHGQPGHRCDIPDGALMPSTTAVSSEAASQLAKFASNNATPGLNSFSVESPALSPTGPPNPAHGQPGHRCDIAVGAPLNSAPAKTSDTSPSSSEKLNPPHGKPGHRCDIAVGAPLNSAPAKTMSTTNQTPSIATSPTTTSLKVNPAHGQPGHRCDIAVGASLDAPKKTAASSTVSLPPVANTPVKPDTAQPRFETITDSTGKIVRLNPPHGQPGHDCTVPTGKPLKQ